MSPGPSPYLRFPHVRGDVVTFVADDAVWLVPLGGGRATRLTGGREKVAHPRLSPDGTRFAWTAWTEEQPEVYVSAIDGGTPVRLTYWGCARTGTRGWTPDGRVLAVSDVGQPSTARTFAHALAVDGEPGVRLPYGWADEVAFGPGEEVLVATAAGVNRDLAWWKRYRGGTAARLWVSTGGGPFARLLPDHAASLTHPMFVGDRILVVTDHEGSGRLYVLDEDRTALGVVAEHEFYVRHATTDGHTVVYVAGGDLFALDAEDAVRGRATPRRLDVTLTGVRAGREPRVLDLGDRRAAVAVDRTGRASAVEARGTVHWLAHRDGPARALHAVSGARARVPVVAGSRVAFVTDDGGRDSLEVVGPDGTSRRLAAGLLGRVLEAAASPDGAHLAVASHDGRLSVIDLDPPAAGSGDPVREVARATEGEVTGLAWSPDSTWLAWSHPGPEPLRQIRLARADGSGTLDATPLRFSDTNPVFTADGLHLAFLSVRSLDPVYDAFSFDLAFPGGCRPHLLPLGARTPSPFDAQVGGRPADRATGDRPPADGDAEQGSARPTVVDAEGLAERVVPFPVPAGRYRDVRVVEGGVVWLHLPAAGELGDDLPSLEGDRPRPALERFDLEERRLETLADAVDEVWASGDGRRLVVADAGVLRVLPSDHRVADGPDGDKERIEVDLSRLRLHLDPVAEWHQMFDEAGRLMAENFWRPDLVGEQWDAVLDRYRPLVDRLGSHDDLVDLLWEVQGELGTSHAFVSAPEREGRRSRQGQLGADLERAADGSWQVVRVLPGETSEPRARSPLTAPGVDVRAGDQIVAVDGRPVPPAGGPPELLAGMAGLAVELTVRRAGELRRVAVTPTADEKPLRYQHWVADRRAFVQDRSEGRLGYLHVPDMMSTGWAQLHRDLRLEMAREGVVVDIRENRGGHTSQLVIGILARRVVGWDLGRGYSPAPYPLDGPRGAVVALADEWAGSDGDIVTAAIQAMEIAPVVGMRTWGGVVGIDMKYRLVDGTVVTQPRFAFWLEGKGWGVENHGVDPDVEVVQTPTDRSEGRDPQLEEAVRLALEALERRPAARPPALPGERSPAVSS